MPYRSSGYQAYLDRPESAFYAVFGLSLTVQLFIFGYVSYLTAPLVPGNWLLWLMIPIFGSIFLVKVDSAPISMVGGLILSAGLGAISGPAFAQYQLGSILNIAFLTMLVTVGMSVAGFIFRSTFAAMGGGLFVALTMLIFSDLLSIMLSFFGFDAAPLMKMTDIAAVGVFSLYIAYDMSRLDEVRDIDGAIDLSVSVFLDIVNLMLRLLELMGKKK